MGRELRDYRQALDFLFERTQGREKLGLDRMRAFLDAMGNPHAALPCLHVAGTNGKGSTVATLEALLRARGLSVGKYTSPHLVDFTERVLVDGVPVSSDEVVEFVERWTPEVERTGASFFEATTAMAFDVFARARVDVAVIEVGLGGRLDSTNVITPLVAGVTSIGLDHQELLGDTRELIAGEKAGIFKAGVPAVIGESDPGIAAELVRHARERGASVVRVVHEESRVSDVRVGPDGTRFRFAMAGAEPVALRTSLAGRHQATNTAVALTMLDAAGPAWRVSPDDAAAVLPRIWLPGRFQMHGRHIFDVAHNADGMIVMEQTLRLVNPPRPAVAVLNVLADKDWRAMMRVLARAVDHLVLTVSPTSPASRRWDPVEAAAFAEANGWPATLEPDFGRALVRAGDMGATVIVTGSFHTVGDAMVALNVNPLAR
ncbi:MAG: bifunctional folylpolyglutamate synthase/dihydrofolate synthase [Gemmatimonadetes bacterium]|nr:bifunctional folylpolyglutamate synthase/dihydrofolate synthase [Gemmatimonadota bacterium]